LLQEVAALARAHRVMIHTHASENKKECEIVESETGRRNVAYLDAIGISGDHVMLAHCIHLDAEEMEILARAGTNVSHCPSSNLKLGSGLARVAEMLARKISVSLGAERRLQQPAGHVYRDAHSGAAAKAIGPEDPSGRECPQMAPLTALAPWVWRPDRFN
jgi:hypothetical protein